MATAPPIVLNAQLIAAALGGTFAGGLHAVTGPDHLAALLPLCIGRRWCAAMHTGAYWGLGHGIGAALVGALAYFVRGALNLDVLCTYMEAAVGLSIIIIGWNGVGEAREWRTEHEGPTQVAAQHNLEVALAQPAVETVGVGSTLLTGILHGCSGSGRSCAATRTPHAVQQRTGQLSAPREGWDGGARALVTPRNRHVQQPARQGPDAPCFGRERHMLRARTRKHARARASAVDTLGRDAADLLGVLPALAMPSWSCASTYLVSFGLGTMLVRYNRSCLHSASGVRSPHAALSPNVSIDHTLHLFRTGAGDEFVHCSRRRGVRANGGAAEHARCTGQDGARVIHLCDRHRVALVATCRSHAGLGCAAPRLRSCARRSTWNARGSGVVCHDTQGRCLFAGGTQGARAGASTACAPRSCTRWCSACCQHTASSIVQVYP